MVKGIHMNSSAKKKNAKLTWRDVGITIGTLAATTLLCYALRPFAGGEKFEAILFVVAVLIISRFTNGCLRRGGKHTGCADSELHFYISVLPA